MRRLIVLASLVALLGTFSMGCGDTSTTTRKQSVSGPGGETTVEQKTTVEKKGDNPPNP